MANDADAIDQMNRITELEHRLVDANLVNQRLHQQMGDLPLLQNFAREVSEFHREALLPLVELVKKSLPPGSEATRYLEKVIARTKHFENQRLVADARQSANDELKRLTVK